MPFLWDYYIINLKVFDILSLVVAIFCIIFLTPTQLKTLNNSRILIFLTFFLFFAIVGLINYGDPKGFMGIVIGISYFYLATIYFEKYDIERFSYYILLILILTFLLQYFSTVFFGQPINYHSIIGETPRIQNAIGYRTSGLFLEPTSYCAMMFMLIMTRFLLNSYTIYEFIGIITILMSFSLYGFFVSIFLIGFWAIYNVKKFLAVLFCIIFLIPIFLPLYQVNNIFSSEIQFLIIDRLTSLFTDASVQARYRPQEFSDQSLLQTLFGNGLSTQGTIYGTSGLGYLVSGIGVIGFIFFIILSINLYRKNTIIILSGILVVLMSSYYWTYIVFWMWMAWLYILIHNKKNFMGIIFKGN